MDIGIIGLGAMGNAIAYRLLGHGHKVVGYDLDKITANAAQNSGVEIVDDVIKLALKVEIIWLMVPAGNIVSTIIATLIPHMRKSTIVIDGGNSNFHDSIKHAQQLRSLGFFFLDCGTSGGLHGREIGFSLMVGGDHAAYLQVEPILQAIAAAQGYGYMGPSGAGHYVKMVHNGIEYGLLQAYAEGFHLLKEGSYKNLDLAAIAKVWNNGSIIRSWLLTLMQETLVADPQMLDIIGSIAQGGTGLWAAQEAKCYKIPVPCLDKALEVRSWSQKTGGNYATKLIAMTRNKFGGHKVVTKKNIV